LYGAEQWTIGNVIRYSWEVFKCDAGERLPDCVRIKVCHRANEWRNSLHTV